MRMEDWGAFGAYEESMDDLKQKLHFTTIQLEMERMKASEAIAKHKEHLMHLLSFLKVAYQERDEAREQLRNLLTNAYTPPNNAPTFSQGQHPAFHATLADSGLTQSNILPEIHHLDSHGLFPANSICKAAPTQDLLNTNDSNATCAKRQRQTFTQYTNGLPGTFFVSSENADIHRASQMIDKLVEGKPLPQKGKLLQAVTEAGPLLETLLVVGSLPKWKNPPSPRRLKPSPTPVAKKPCLRASSPLEKTNTDFRAMIQETVILGHSANSGIAHQSCSASISSL